ncbi:MAG: ankyrin repeat domain-containing protein, partial [Anaerolineae bacterium]
VLLNICEAAALGRTSQIIRILARQPEMVDACGEDGFPPLSVAARFGQSEVIEFLIRAGAPLNLPANNPLKSTPLHAAVEGKQLEAARILLDHGADPNARRADGATPLHLAAQTGQTEMIILLLYNGADLKIKDDNGKTPLDWAVESNQERAAEVLRSEITKRFRKTKARSIRKP